jgi:hypothetical protein
MPMKSWQAYVSRARSVKNRLGAAVRAADELNSRWQRHRIAINESVSTL